MHRSEGATALLGMEEFVVGAQLEVDGEVWLMVETTAGVGCDGCGTRAVAGLHVTALEGGPPSPASTIARSVLKVAIPWELAHAGVLEAGR